jgi:DNA-binding GntR family transcriptional regulator
MNFSRIVIDKRRTLALSTQVYEGLLKELASSFLPTNTLLPSPTVLARQLKLSRADVEPAYQALCDEGFLKHVDQTFLIQQRIMRLKHDSLVSNLYLAVRDLGLQPKTKTTQRAPVKKLPSPIPLKTHPQDLFNVYERVVYGDQIPLAFVQAHFSNHYFKHLNAIEFEDQAFYEGLAKHERYDIQMQRNAYATYPPEEAVAALGIPRNTPCMLMESIGYDENGVCVDYTLSWQIASYFSFEFDVHLT